jgi:hypothetical protein
MANPYHHALSSVKKWGGKVEDYHAIHQWFDESKMMMADARHRALRHHSEGIFMAERFFGPTIKLSTGKVIPTRWVGEQHVREDCGFIPSMQDWFKHIKTQPWMMKSEPLSRTLEAVDQ